MFEMTRENKVNEFRTAADKKNFEAGDLIEESILNTIEEETGEFFGAAYDYETALLEGTEEEILEARAQLCKEWADMQYVVSQAAIYFDIPADPSFNRVHESNMSKVVEGKVIFREDGKILKPETYVAPNMRGL